jgi:pSer/pThr/pTyr-binding forkhead associated (FHA) protein
MEAQSAGSAFPAKGAPWEKLPALRDALAQAGAEPFLVELPSSPSDGGGDALAWLQGAADPLEALRSRDLSGRRVHHLSAAEGEPTIIGRTACDVILGQNDTSRRHARFSVHSVGWRLLDLESANGTFVAGRRLPVGVPTRVAAGQSVAFANYRAVLLTGEQVLDLLGVDAPTPSTSAGLETRIIREALDLPPQGAPLRDLVELIAGLREGLFLEHCEAGFLLQVPVEAPLPAATEEELKGTVPLSRSRILNLKRSRDVRNAVVHAVFPAPDGLVIGRAGGGADLELPEPSVSKRHARLQRSPAGWRLIDLDSQNGTFVEGKRIPSGVAAPLRPGIGLRLSSYVALWLDPVAIDKLLRQIQGKRAKKG